VFSAIVCHKPPVPPPGRKGLPWRRVSLSEHAQIEQNRRAGLPALRRKESQMPKLKTKSGAKKRFKVTGTGKVLYAQRGKRHGMIKRSNKQIRQLRGTNVMFKTDGERIVKYFLPNG
jgi:large subunit ribosomal protein L35